MFPRAPPVVAGAGEADDKDKDRELWRCSVSTRIRKRFGHVDWVVSFSLVEFIYFRYVTEYNPYE